VRIPQAFVAQFDQRVERIWASFRYGVVSDVSTGSYSSNHPLVELDDANGTLVQLVNYSGETLAVSSKVLILVQGSDQIIIGKHPDT
jgi:hypothetical protein